MNQSDTDDFSDIFNQMKTVPSLSGSFIRGDDIVWKIGGSLFAFVLFFVWALQLFSYVPESMTTYYGLRALIGVFVLITALGYNDSDSPFISQSRSDTDLVLTISRPAELWTSLVDALTAVAICIAAATYILNNTLAAYVLLAYILALILTFMFIPVLPMVAHDSDMSFLKTTIRIAINLDTLSLTDLEIVPHPLERKWEKAIASGELQQSIVEDMIAFIPNLKIAIRFTETSHVADDALPIV
ncbi:MAG: hypothetical protein RTU30_06130 [Candidatus Thorarchaeota archaeon]